MGAAESMKSDEEMLRLCSRVCRDKLGLLPAPLSSLAGGSEDCSYLINRVRERGGKSLYFSTLTSCSGPFHSRTFDFDETALPAAVQVFCGMAFCLMGIE